MDYDVALRLENVESQRQYKYYHYKTSRRYMKIHGPWACDPDPYTFLH